MRAPTPIARQVMERVFRLRAALDANNIDPIDARVCLVLTMTEAFALLDYRDQTEWALPVTGPAIRHSQSMGPFQEIPVFTYDLCLQPRPGTAWASLWNITLIIEDDAVLPPTAPQTCG